MTAPLLSLLAITVAFAGLVVWLLLPGSAALQRHAWIPLDDAEPDASDPGASDMTDTTDATDEKIRGRA